MAKVKEKMLEENAPVEEEKQLPADFNPVRQSAPQMTAKDLLMQNQQMMPADNGAMNGFQALAQVIGREQVNEATQTLQKYKAGKANLERRIIDNVQWYKLRQWEYLRRKDKPSDMVEPTSAHLWNAIENKVADAMDNFPAPNIRPREEGDQFEAEMLTAIIPVILSENDFEETYEDVNRYKLITGTGVYGVFWDASKLNGLGDISIRKVDVLKLFWEPGIMDIQDSHHFFSVNLVENDDLIRQYPQLKGKLGSSTIDVSKYIYDDSIDTSTKSAVVDWYYKKRNGTKTVLHYCKYVNDEVLFATENDPQYSERGWYDHGKYPFIFSTAFPAEGSPCGFGYVDIGKSAQEYIDRGNKAIMENMLANAKPRYFIRNDGSVNEEEYADFGNTIVHVDGSMGTDSIAPINYNRLDSIYVNVLNNKIEELKEVVGNRDISNGGTTSGITAASAIAAVQEAGSKLSRCSSKASFRDYRKMVKMIIELFRQFYDLPRRFRIMGENGKQKFVQYSNAGIAPQAQGNDFGIDMGYRIPDFDVDVSAEKQSPYSKMSQNELALQFYQVGFFNPQMADQALSALNMMDFNGKDAIMNRIAQNGGMYQQMIMMQQQMLQMAQMIDQDRGTNLADQLAAGIMGQPAPVMGGSISAEKNNIIGGTESKSKGEPANVEKARKRVANSTDPT